jgi:hypothetical protein
MSRTVRPDNATCLGGAVAQRAGIGPPWFSRTTFRVYGGPLSEGGVRLRKPDMRGLIPLQRRSKSSTQGRSMP